MSLTGEQRAGWEQNGYLIVPRFFADSEVEAIQSCYHRAWEEARTSVVVDNLASGRRCRMSQLSEEEKQTPFFKVSDLYLEFEEVRQVVLGEKISRIMAELLGDAPVLCNTLNLLRSSQQEDHIDSKYMTPKTPQKLVATWMGLEDTDPDAGLLRYYPGSHKIPLFKFADGSYHEDPSQREEWAEYYRTQVRERGLEPKTFQANRGDLFLWHANLLHGGSKVIDPDLTRDSIVSHFYALSDAKARKYDVVALNSGYWWKRAPQAVPGEIPANRQYARRAARTVLPKRLRRVIRERIAPG